MDPRRPEAQRADDVGVSEVRERAVTAPTRTIERIVRRTRLGDDDDHRTLSYWLAQPMERRIMEVESLRRMWIESFGDPDQPIERIVLRRRLGEDPA